MDVFASVGADEQAAAVMEPGEAALDDPAFSSQPGAVSALTACDHRLDPPLPEQTAVLVVVVAAIGKQPLGPRPRSPDPAADGRDPVEQRDQLGDVVAVAASERPGQRDTGAVYEEVVLAAAPAPVDGAGTRFRAPFFACK